MGVDLGREHGVVLPVRIDPEGLTGPTRAAVEGPEYRRSSRGRYVPTYVVPTAVQRVAEVGAILPPLATPTGWASLSWQKGWWFGGTEHDGVTPLPVPVAAPRKVLRVQPAFTLCRERWDPRDVEKVDGLTVATAVRAVCFEMRYAWSVTRAVVALDMACFHDLVSLDEVTSWVLRHPSYTGIEQARAAVSLGDENSWSPREPPMRLLWVDHGLGTPLTNRPVFDLNGRLLGAPDLIDPVTGVAGEYEGEVHLSGGQRGADVRREALFRQHGIEPVTMTKDDYENPLRFVARLREGYARAAARPASDRRWTLELPPWWVPTFTVAQRRALTRGQRVRFLRHRRDPSASSR